ncbi:glycosyltransferase family 2 protein, partial [Prevotella sp.]|uniref:glycosyltransferase family 2 protein n=1 Tax=Prevotella sp. TaxID=59823 RepID=UPI002F9226B2
MWQILLDFYGYVIFFYSITLIISYVILMLLAQPGIFNQHNEIEEDYAKHVVWNNPYTPGVSIVAPAFNEEMTIIDNVESLLRQDYPLFEVVIVNDGSRDSTLEKLITNFELEKVPFNYVEYIHTKPFKALYRSRNPKYSQLTVVDKVNGGTKADPINAGLNVAAYPYFINTDVDCIL